MPNTIHIPTPLRPFTDKQEAVQVNGATVGELLTDLTTRHSGLRKHLYTDEGRLRNFVNVYLNDEDIRYLQKANASAARRHLASCLLWRAARQPPPRLRGQARVDGTVLACPLRSDATPPSGILPRWPGRATQGASSRL